MRDADHQEKHDAAASLPGDWEIGWDGHEAAQRRRLAAFPFSSKLDWLEEAHRLVLRVERARLDAGIQRAKSEPA